MDLSVKIKHITFALVFIIIGILVLIFSVVYISNELVETIVNLLATSIVITAIFSILVNIFTIDYFEIAFKNLISRDLPFLHKISEIGLVEFDDTFPLKNEIYKYDFINSVNITIVMNDAKKFILII